MDRAAPKPGYTRFDLTSWIDANASRGDTIHLGDGASYWTENLHPRYWQGITLEGNGSKLVTKNPPPSRTPAPARFWNRPVELFRCTDVTIRNLEVVGPAPQLPLHTSSFDVAWEGQHAFSVMGCTRTILENVRGHHVYGDGVYIGGGSKDTVVSGSSFHQIGRNGCSTTAAKGVLLEGCRFRENMRTTLNLEVHEGQTVSGYVASGCQVGWHGLNVITSTGEGVTLGAIFRDLTCGKGRPFNAQVYGTGAKPNRDYGRRENIRLENITGGEPHRGRSYYIQLLNIEGLTVTACDYPMVTTGSTPGRVQ